MVLAQDVELNGTAFNVVPGSYKKGLRKRLSPSKPAARQITRTTFGPFTDGFGQALAGEGENHAGWSGVTVGPAFGGLGVEPFPNTLPFSDALPTAPTATTRAYGLVAGDRAYTAIGTRMLQWDPITVSTWNGWAQQTTAFAAPITGLTYFKDDILIFLGPSNDIRLYNTATSAVVVWVTGEKAKYGVAYAGQLIYAPCAANNQEELRLSVTKWNGNRKIFKRYLDAPIINMALFNGKVVIATRKSLYYMGGQPDPGEEKDPDITNDTGRPAAWIGEPEPIMSHGVFAEGDDFTFLDSYRGKLYTWLGGHVAQFDPAGQGSWKRTGPEGTACYGATVAGDWLIVAIAGRYGTYEAWGFDGAGWWLLLQRSAAGPAVLWPVPLAGTAKRDVLLFRDGSSTYDLLRLRWRSSTDHTYATAGTWTSGVIDGGDPSADKAWRAIGATFASPEIRGNSASVDSVDFPLEYSLDGGATWTTAVSTPASSGSSRVFTREIAFPTPPESRLLQIRQSWASVSDWAPVLGGLWVESEDAAAYALAELAAATYADELAAEGLQRRRWELTIDASDRNVKRDGQVDAKTGRAAIAALWDAWELGTTISFKDVDNDDDPVTYVVAITGMEEKAGKPSDAGRWGESAVTLVIEESAPGVAAAPPNFDLEALADVALGGLSDGDVLTYDSGTGLWSAEPAPGGSLDADLVTIGALTPADGDVIQRVTGSWASRTMAQLKTALGLVKGDVGLGNVDNTSDVNKPVSTAQAAADATRAALVHTHAAGDVTSGQFAIARLASGTPNGTQFIRDDGVLATPAGGGGSPLVYVSTTVEQFINTAALSDFTNRYTIPANNAAVGKVYRLTVRGIINNGSGVSRTYTFAVRLGGVTVGTFPGLALAAGVVNKGYEITASLIVVSTGAGGTAELQGSIRGNADSLLLANTATVSFDTTAAKTFGVAVTMAANAAVNTDQRQITVEAMV